MLVWVSGPTGSGKTSLTRAARAVGYSVVEERLPEDLFHSFASDPVHNCARLQEAIMRSRYEAWRGLSKDTRIIFDRSIDEDTKVFCQMHHELGLLDDKQYEALRCLGRELQERMPAPELIVFMSSGLRTLAERATHLTHPPTIVENLERQISLYEEWLATRREDILRLDNSACGVQTIRRLFREIHQC
jgi:deoxyadenosine/deoxycytidine kinase